MANNIDKEVIVGFVEEAKSYLPTILQGLESFQKDQSSQESLEKAHRLLHTIKGAAAMMGLAAFSHIVYCVEDALEDIIAGNLATDREAFSLLFKTLSQIEGYLDSVASGSSKDHLMLDETTRAYRRMRGLPVEGDQEAVASILSEIKQDATVAEDDFLDDEDVSAELLEAFSFEAEDHLRNVSLQLGELEKNTADKSILQEVRRGIHILKGAAGTIGLRDIASLCHRMEDMLDQLYEDSITMTSDSMDLLCSTADTLEDLVVNEKEVTEQQLEHLQSRYASLLGDETPPAPQKTDSSSTAGSSELNLEYELDDDILPELLEAFNQEAEDHLRNISFQLTELNNNQDDKNVLQEIRRGVHTLKGAAGTIGIKDVAELSHLMEDVLDQLYDDRRNMDSATMDLLCESADTLDDMLSDETVPDERLPDLQQRYRTLLGQTSPEKAAAAGIEPLGEEKVFDLTQFSEESLEKEGLKKSADKVEAVTPRKPGEVVRVPIDRLDDLVKLVSELVITRTIFEQRLGLLTSEVEELHSSINRLQRLSGKLETQYEVKALGSGQIALSDHSDSNDDFDDLEFDRYTEFHLLTRELAETSNDMKTVGSDLSNLIGDFDSALNRQSRISTELQEKLMRARMVPLANLTTRFHRAVRVVARPQGKLVKMVVEGENIELDKTVLEDMADPLLHIIRNAVDHGIEPPELRLAMGKSEEGELRLQAYHEGNQVVIRVSDDGSGIDPQILRAAAVEKGFLAEADSVELSDDELYSLIFLPGFSTAGEISQISGRGVGMDIVKENVNKLKGTVTVDSTSGQGTSFTVRLPMTMAVTQALLVRANREMFAIPLGAVNQILRVDKEEIENIGQEKIIRIAGQVYPIQRLGEVMSLKQGPDTSDMRQPMLIVQAGEKQIALIVDQIIKGTEIVIKPLGDHLRHVHGIGGATLMGDGSVVLIINPTELIQEPAQAIEQTKVILPASIAAAHRPLNIMIVDDSVSVRRVVSNLITNAGWKPTTAKDGMEALTIIQQAEQPPDLMLVDIEMPRMDGFELTTTLRSRDRYKKLPIIMLTSRAGEKHRKKGFKAGVTEYVTKPYRDEVLLTMIRRCVTDAKGV